MKLEEGKYYRTRDGKKVGPMELRAPMSVFPFYGRFPDGGGATFTAGGCYLAGEESTIDLMAEWDGEADGWSLPEPPAKTILQEAADIVAGARRGAYGTPERNFDRIAVFWNAYMTATGRDVKLTAADISPMMRLMKEARLCETPGHRDSLVDLIGYTLTGAEVNGVEKIPVDGQNSSD